MRTPLSRPVLRWLLGLLTLLAFFYVRWGPLPNPFWPVAGLLGLALVPGGRILPRSRPDVVLGALILSLAIGLTVTSRWTGATAEPRALWMGLVLAYLVARTVETVGGEDLVFRVALGMTVVLVAIALAQLALYLSTGYFFTFQTGEFAGIAPSRWTPCCGLPAVSSVYGDPRDFSVRLAGLAGLVGFGGLFLGRRRWPAFTVFGLSALLLLLDFTRAAVLALGVVTATGVVLALYRRRIAYGRAAVLAIAGLAVAFLLSPLPDRLMALEARSPAFRLELWRTYWEHLGFWGARVPAERISLHSVHLAMLFFGGWPTLVLWVFLWGDLVAGLLRDRSRPVFWWYLTFLGGSLGYAVAYGLFSGYGFPLFWIVLGVTIGLRARLQAEVSGF